METGQRNHIKDWIAERKSFSALVVNQIEQLTETPNWKFKDGAIRHDSGNFFSIIGFKQLFNNGLEKYQPLIDQPEVGILGFILAKNKNGASILLQAKTEPGNIEGTQIAPSVQATYSNYMQVHGGKPTKFLKYFIRKTNISIDTLQSEQGTRFLSKYNRNTCVILSSENELNENPDPGWNWFPVVEVLGLMSEDYLINTDSRSVLACSDWIFLADGNEPFLKGDTDFGRKLYRSFNVASRNIDFKDVLENLRKKNSFRIETHSICNLRGWNCSNESIKNRAAFAVKSFSIVVRDREVEEWSQPLLHSYHTGTVKLYCQLRDQLLYFLISGSTEIGFKKYVQFGPSYQLVDGVSSNNDLNLDENKLSIIEEFKQTDEGGRFYQSIVHYMVQEIDEGVDVQLNDNQVWMTLNDIYRLLPKKGMFTNEFRSVLSVLLKYI